jgi:hypothetical protein
MTDSQLQAWLDQEDEHVAQTIRKYGLFIQLVSHDRGDSPPAFAYTVGLFGLGHPELVVLGMDTGSAGGLLNHLGERIRAGETLCRAACSASTSGRIASPSKSYRTRERSCSRPTVTTSDRPRRRCRRTS